MQIQFAIVCGNLNSFPCVSVQGVGEERQLTACNTFLPRYSIALNEEQERRQREEAERGKEGLEE